MANISAAFQVAFQHHQAGRLDLAEEIYRRILAIEPDHAEALHLLGAVAHQTGRHAMAADYIGRAIGLNPSDARYHMNLGRVFRALGKTAEASACYQRAIQCQPAFAEAWNDLGTTLADRGELDEALNCFERAVQLNPSLAEAHYNLGTSAKDQGKLDEALACYERAIQLKPDYAQAHNNQGAVWQQQGNLDQALACYARAIESQPDNAQAHHNLGGIRRQEGRSEEAIACYRRAIQCRPAFAEAWNDLGTTLSDRGELDQALACFQHAVQLNPDLAEAHTNLGSLAKDQGKLDDALACYDRALKLNPGSAAAHSNLGNALKDQGKLDEALACYQQALKLNPDLSQAHSCLLLGLNYRQGITPAELRRAHAEYDRLHAAPLRAAWRSHANVRAPERTLRLGFLSSDFGRHPVGYFYLRPLECLRAKDCQIACYSTRLRQDDFTARFHAAAHIWREVPGISDDALAEQIRADGVDILFDLASHAGGNRLLVFARKPAPVQIAWAGPTGISAMDYILTDKHLFPAGAEPSSCEKPLRMPDAYACYEPPAEAPPVASLPALDRGSITFGSLNNLAKITPQVLDAWAQILRRLPTSRLVVRYGVAAVNPGARSRLCDSLARAGIATSRIDVFDGAPYAKRLDLYNEIDLSLDCFPFSGCTTTCEAMWMGVPVITCPGETYLSRQSLSVLRNVGLDEPIARDLPDYVDRAVALANDLPRLAALRAGLRQRMAASPLCDGPRFAGNLLHLLRGVWRDWCNRSESP